MGRAYTEEEWSEILYGAAPDAPVRAPHSMGDMTVSAGPQTGPNWLLIGGLGLLFLLVIGGGTRR